MGTTIWPRPEERENYVPLQAADLLVWHRRRCRDHSDGRERPVWRALEAAAKPAMIQPTRQILALETQHGVLASLLPRWNAGIDDLPAESE